MKKLCDTISLFAVKKKANAGNLLFRNKLVKEMIMKIKTTKKCATAKVVAKKTAIPAVKKQTKPVAKAVTFTFHAEKGKAIYVAGEFNKWNPTAKKMAYKAKDGIYAATVKLVPGEYQYKFVIDGTWCADPENANSVKNDQGTFNSIIVVK